MALLVTGEDSYLTLLSNSNDKASSWPKVHIVKTLNKARFSPRIAIPVILNIVYKIILE